MERAGSSAAQHCSHRAGAKDAPRGGLVASSSCSSAASAPGGGALTLRRGERLRFLAGRAAHARWRLEQPELVPNDEVHVRWKDQWVDATLKAVILRDKHLQQRRDCTEASARYAGRHVNGKNRTAASAQGEQTLAEAIAAAEAIGVGPRYDVEYDGGKNAWNLPRSAVRRRFVVPKGYAAKRKLLARTDPDCLPWCGRYLPAKVLRRNGRGLYRLVLDDGSESGLCCDNVDRGDICEAPPGHNHNPLQLDSAAARLQLPRLRSALDLPPACGAQPLHDHGGTL